jgi:outer membrane protein assembly factor BamB
MNPPTHSCNLHRPLLATAGTAIVAAHLLVAPSLSANDWPQWRGSQRNGVSAETGLLPQWPVDGPKLAWQARDLGSGYSTPAVVGDRLFVLGNQGMDNEFVEARSVADGKQLWQTRLGKVGKPDQQPSFPAARSTPTCTGDQIYALGSDGDLACLDPATGQIRWQKNLRTEFAGKSGTWAYAESPLVDGNTLVCTPGGAEATLVALDRLTGAVRWKSAVPGGDEAAYASAIIVEVGGVRQYVQMLQKGLVAVAANTGQHLWRYDKTISKYGANIPSPLARDGLVYSAGAGTGGGAVRIKAAPPTVEIEPVYFSAKLPAAIGGAVLVGDHLYGTGSQSLLCVEFATGTVKWEERALGPASLCLADGRLYLHGENGEVALVEPSPTGYAEKGRFTPPDPPKRLGPMEKAWTYPVVANQRLYIRDHAALWCYAIARR